MALPSGVEESPGQTNVTKELRFESLDQLVQADTAGDSDIVADLLVSRGTFSEMFEKLSDYPAFLN